MRLHHLVNNYVLRGEFGTFTWSHPDRNVPAFEERSIGWTLSVEGKAWTSAGFYAGTCTKYQVHILRINKSSSISSPESNSSSPPVTTSKEGESTVDSGASLRMMSKSDLTPEEQETIWKSKDPSVVTTANGTTHRTEATVCL